MAALDFPASPSNGDIYNGFKYVSAKGVWQALAVTESSIAALTDVEITSPAEGDLLVYNNSTSKWENHHNIYDDIKFVPNTISYASNYSTPSGYSGITVGPITVQNTITLTITNGTTLVVL